MAIRRRPVSEFEATAAKIGSQTVTLEALAGGYNGYTAPNLLSPQFWAAASQCYAGLFGTIRRARFAPAFNNTATGYVTSGLRMESMFALQDITNAVEWVLFENQNTSGNGPRWVFQYPLANFTNLMVNTKQASPVTSIWTIVNNQFGQLAFPLSLSMLAGPYSRVTINNFILEANNQFRSKVLYGLTGPGTDFSPFFEFWGIDAPDVSPSITLSAGLTASISSLLRTSNVVTVLTTANHGFTTGQYVTISGVADSSFNSASGTTQQISVTGSASFTFAQVGTDIGSTGGTATVQITQTVGRSYQYAWENANTGHVSAPSPASQFVKYSNQIGTIDLVEPGTISFIGGSTAVTGVGTSFSAAWAGKLLWTETLAGGTGQTAFIQSVTDGLHMTLAAPYPALVSASGSRFMVIDPQVTHVRLYETGDGGSVYFRTARNVVAFGSGGGIGASSGLRFTDTSNSQPPNAPFTSEITQNFNVPPPIGKYVADYQGRPIVFGVPGAQQSFFYGNMETTVVGQPPESFAPLNQVTLPIGDGIINGWANLPTGAVIWSNHQDMFKLAGLLTDNTVSNQFQLGATIQRLPYRLGCGSAFATTVTNLGVFWLTGDRQVMLFTDHYAPKNVGIPIQDILNRINGRISFARMKNYKRGERNWLALAVSLDSSTFNNKLLLLDLDLLASNGQPSYFTFDMATNQPTWYLFDINCECIETALDNLSQNHLLCGDVDLITDADYHTNDFTIASEQNVSGGTVTLHALGNENPELIKQIDWLRANTNQLPSALQAQGWSFGILQYDDEQWVLNAVNTGNLVTLTPGVNSDVIVRPLENSPADFRLNQGQLFAKGRRLQLQVNFPSTPGNWEFRGFQVRYTNNYER